MKIMARAKRKQESGMALLLTLFALLLLSAIGLFLALSSDTETRIDANYGSNLHAYYAARSGLEEVRDRAKYQSAQGGIADLLPQNVAGDSGGVLYILNPAAGEVVDPTNARSLYFDDELCHDYNSGASAGTKCTKMPGIAGWSLPAQTSLTPSTGPLGYKWIRINMKTNRIAAPYFVDQTGTTAPLDTRVCWDGQTEQLSPGGTSPACDANGMQTVYILTSLAVTPSINGLNGSRKLLRFEVAAPSIRPPGAITIETMGATKASPVATLTSALTSGGIPLTAVDGRPHTLDGELSTTNQCSSVASVATNSTQASAQLQQALDAVRQGIVQTANASCKADGSGLGGNTCTPGLWWVRGTDLNPRFATDSTGGEGNFGVMAGGPSDGSQSLEAMTMTSSFTALNLASPQLYAVSASFAEHIPVVILPANATAPFVGNQGNQADAIIYQASQAQIVQNEIAAIHAFVATSTDQANYFSAPSTNLAMSYGTRSEPAVVVITGSGMKLQNTTLAGYGILVVPNGLEITNATLQWNGIVVVQGANGKFVIGAGANGFINGALLLQSGSAMNLQTSVAGANAFRLLYSCEAIDLAFASRPFKIVSASEVSF